MSTAKQMQKWCWDSFFLFFFGVCVVDFKLKFTAHNQKESEK